MVAEAAVRREFVVEYACGISYDEAMQRQRGALARLRRDRSGPGLLLVAEHVPLVTMGRSGSEDHLRLDADELNARGIAYHEARRGGDVTYHGPGQMTLYPVFPLEWWGRDLHAHMRRLEEVAICYLAGHGIAGGRVKGLTGAWVGEEKLAAIGISVSAWICFYGLAVNVQPDLEHFSYIVPCGITDRSVTSLSNLTGKAYDMDREMHALVASFFEVFDGACERTAS